MVNVINHSLVDRMCVGKDLAIQSLFINIACILWAFNIDKALDNEGRPIVPSRSDCIDEGLAVYVPPS